jgi:hypothetical protein
MVSKHFKYGKYGMVYIIERHEMGIFNGIHIYFMDFDTSKYI